MILNVTLIKVSQNLPTRVLATSLLVVHDACRSGQHNEPELTRRQQVVDPFLDFTDLDVETGGDDTGLVQATVQLDDDLAGAMIVNDLKLANVSYKQMLALDVNKKPKIVTVLLHDGQELYDDLAGRADENLAFTALLGIDHVVEAV